MLWIYTAILSYFLLAVASVGDRFFLIGLLPNPKIYAFLVGIVGIPLVAIFAPLGFSVPDAFTIFLSLAAGFIWIAALVVYFEAIHSSEVSRVVPAVGALVPIFTFLAATFLSGEILSKQEFLAFLLLLSGGVFMTAEKLSLGHFVQNRSFVKIFFAALLVAPGVILMKEIFLRESFINGFIWIRMGTVVGAVALLFFSEVRDWFFKKSAAAARSLALPFVFFQGVGGAGTVLQAFAIYLAKFQQVSLVNALEGTRYLFLFFFVLALSKFRPAFLNEKMQGPVLIQKMAAGAIIISGVILLALDI